MKPERESVAATLTPDLRDLVLNQPFLPISPDESDQQPCESLLRAISSSSLIPGHSSNLDISSQTSNGVRYECSVHNLPNAQEK